MATCTTTSKINCDIKRVWQVVTSFKECVWRSDLKETKILDETHFVEISKNSRQTNFKITLCKPYERLELEIENESIKGSWIGNFKEENSQTILNFTENIKPKNIFLAPILYFYLKKQQNLYISDLKRALNC
ncbi:polyketide cyclase [Campylobacter sp. RM16192]|uniref:polyketide cyclase n=1 Tax=Campylobacter sp. RM16192 TaxID=1660080 RepID=UPI00145249A6|nr:polyketide cyclase [Campylobacter sp. RM16192]QCD51944.1 polyketide cyclase [Campylobacter sp. RM16192]